MKHRLCLPDLDRSGAPLPGTTVTLSAEQSHYLVRVLRLQQGAEIGLCNGRGAEWQASVCRLSTREARAEIVALARTEAPPQPLVLAQAWLKGSAMDTVIQKAVELGVTSLWLLQTDRTNVKLDEHRMARKLGHLRRVAANAFEQCESLWLPDLIPVDGVAALLDRPRVGLTLFLDPGCPPLSAGPEPVPVTLLVGPEGGWSEKERQLALADPTVTAAGLGALILRAETAPLAALAAIRQDWGWRR